MEFDEKEFKPSSYNELIFHQLEEQSDICDVTIQVGQWKKKYHWCVLVMSPFFDCIRRSDYIEKQTSLVKLDVGTPVATETAILFLYGIEPKLTEENVAAVLELSEFLLIPNLKSTCVAFLKDISITVENCIELLDLSNLYEFGFSQCDDYIRVHLPETLKTEEARFLTKEYVLALLSDPVHSYVQAEERFEFAIAWATASQKNKDSFPDVFEVIDLKSMDVEFLETVVLQHPLVIDIKCNFSNFVSFQDHRVLLFPESNDKKRIACFDLVGELWCGIETGPPDDSDLENSIRNASVDGTCGYMEVYKVTNRHDECKVYIQNVHSKTNTVSIVTMPENTESKIKLSAYDISSETYVAVSNERTCIVSNRPAWSISNARSALAPKRAKYIPGHSLVRYEDIAFATVYYGQLQNPEIPLSPILIIRNEHIDLVCINANKEVGFYSVINSTLYIYDLYNCKLDTIPLGEHFGTDSRYSEIRLAAKKAGFVLYNTDIVLSVSRSNGSDLTERYSVQKTQLKHDRECDRSIYIYSNNMWFRLQRRELNDDVEFACISHNALMGTNNEDLPWKQLPTPPQGIDILEGKHAFMMELPKSMLRCHFDCPHCLPLIEQRRSSQSSNRCLPTADNLSLYPDSDDDSFDNSYDFNYDYDNHVDYDSDIDLNFIYDHLFDRSYDDYNDYEYYD